MLVIGDNLGAIVGGVSDKAECVDVFVPDEQYAEAIQCRYANREGINVVVPGISDQYNSEQKYGYVIICLEDCKDNDEHDFYEVDYCFELIRNHLADDTRLIVVARGDMEYHLQRILHKNGFYFYNAVDPLGNGYLFMEASRRLDLPKESYRLIICSGNARAAETFLKENGYSDYYIFWYNRDWMLYANQSAIWKEIVSNS